MVRRVDPHEGETLVSQNPGIPVITLQGASGQSAGLIGLSPNPGTGRVLFVDASGNIVTDANLSWDATNGLAALKALAQRAPVISGQGAGPTALTAAQSGSVVLHDATANRYTLPAPVVGLWLRFLVTATTGSNHQIDTDAGTTFLVGMVNSCIDATATDKPFAANGSSHTHVIMNGTTTGGIKGTYLEFICVDATHWLVTGTLAASGTLATPFS